ncbi:MULTISPECIES: YkgJ family cysteine cluster protein [unclassified Marinobacter]|uniref:YkgJ family cysteine cluster protein n=1 Tax=unclassified Marinobacter TaxID=83889 RepID=UPI0026E40054|nr:MULTISPECIES: YkgJ family cysteine cluster protein [unclassified Marinobacter]MDO6441006.1 YkgJ family cysteine cluster protein [Marinobacter sp. 2_MG-2023]MDO6823842.1 YkgJ family cysteine cluster protein [Marinobacter sp. 1_MG-2023]
MLIDTKAGAAPAVSCSNCEACCCRLEVMLISETGVPERFIETDKWGGQTMARSEDGWCAALDRSTMSCSIYESRPFICREFEMGGYECIAERAANEPVE